MIVDREENQKNGVKPASGLGVKNDGSVVTWDWPQLQTALNYFNSLIGQNRS